MDELRNDIVGFLFERARQAHQLGQFSSAARDYRDLLARDPGHLEARFHLDSLEKQADVPLPSQATIIWQTIPDDPAGYEVEFLRRCLAHLNPVEHVDTRRQMMAAGAIVIDRVLTHASLGYYQAAYRAGYRFALLHLGDEAYTEPRDAYRYAAAVIRHYWSPFLANDRRVMTLPLGWRWGFEPVDGGRPAADRSHLWSFMGDPNKGTRPAMLAALAPYGPAFRHLTAGFNTSANLPVETYQSVLEDSIVAPCPAGFFNIESYRIWEALEAGAVPIVEARDGFDYFRAAFGPHPLPVVHNWTAAAPLLAHWSDKPAEIEALRQACLSWWRQLRDQMPALVARHLSNGPTAIVGGEVKSTG